MLTELGAKLGGDNPDPRLNLVNVLGKNILAYLDPPHLIKLTRNTLGDYGTLMDADGGIIKWEYIVKLNELQKQEGFVLANKLKQEHIDFYKNKMKVKLASQVSKGSL